jgi:hypothetical protein
MLMLRQAAFTRQEKIGNIFDKGAPGLLGMFLGKIYQIFYVTSIVLIHVSLLRRGNAQGLKFARLFAKPLPPYTQGFSL